MRSYDQRPKTERDEQIEYWIWAIGYELSGCEGQEPYSEYWTVEMIRQVLRYAGRHE